MRTVSLLLLALCACGDAPFQASDVRAPTGDDASPAGSDAQSEAGPEASSEASDPTLDGGSDSHPVTLDSGGAEAASEAGVVVDAGDGGSPVPVDASPPIDASSCCGVDDPSYSGDGCWHYMTMCSESTTTCCQLFNSCSTTMCGGACGQLGCP